jgi:hypothetical protein
MICKRILNTIALASVFLMCAALADDGPEQWKITDIARLAGHWSGTGHDGETTGAAESIWTDPTEGVMSLTFRWHQDDQNHVHFAFSVIEETPAGVLLRGIHHGRDFGTFEDANWTMRLANAGPDSARFDCVEHCRAASVEFARSPDGELIESWRSVAGEEPVFVITYLHATL